MEQQKSDTPRSINLEGLGVVEKCPICLEFIYDKIPYAEIDKCSHILCESCFRDLINFSNNCPLCLQSFTSCKIKNLEQNSTQEYILNLDDHLKIKEHKNSFSKEETFECFTKEQMLKELKNYKIIAENLKNNLFVHRNCDGSEKEYSVYEEIMDRVGTSNDLLRFGNSESKEVVKNLEIIVRLIGDLQCRKYVYIKIKLFRNMYKLEKI